MVQSNGAVADHETYRNTEAFFSQTDLSIWKYVTLTGHFFPSYTITSPLALLFCNFLGFLSTPLIASKGNLERYLK
jgi:hypothetical protein